MCLCHLHEHECQLFLDYPGVSLTQTEPPGVPNQSPNLPDMRESA